MQRKTIKIRNRNSIILCSALDQLEQYFVAYKPSWIFEKFSMMDGFSDWWLTMSVKLLHIALTLTLTCAVSLHYANARSLGDVTGGDDVIRSRDKRSASYIVPAGVASLPVMAAGDRSIRPAVVEAEAWSLLSGDERAHLAELLADTVLLEQLRHRRPLRQAWETPYDQVRVRIQIS